MDQPESSRAVHTALSSYDLLLHLFEQVRLCKGIGASTLASCVCVCHAWEEPASYVLWRDLASFRPLWNVLAGRTFSPESKWLAAYWQFIDAEDFVKDVVEREPERWKHFLHRASHVREVGVAACQKSELALIRVLTKYNRGQTFLPSLQRLSWRHAVPTDTSVLLLASRSLRDLEISISRLGSESTGGSAFATPQRYGDYHDVDPIFVGLAAVAPSLARFSIAGREGPGTAILPHILDLTRLRELCLFNQSLVLTATHLRSLLESLEQLEVLFVRVVDFAHIGAAVYAPNLTELRVQGSSKDLCGVLSGFLDAPHLSTLSLKSVDGVYSQMDHYLFPLIASSTFSRSLRTVSVVVLNDPYEVAWNELTASSSYGTIIRPLFGLPDLEDVDICLANTTMISCGDEDIHEIARAWKNLQVLSLGYSPIGARTLPPLTSLRHFADHCPQLQQLSISKLTLPEGIEVPPTPRYPPHPLMYLDLKMTFAVNIDSGRLEKVLLAQYIDHLFPNLVLSDPEVSVGVRMLPLHPRYFSWGVVEQEIRTIRNQRPAGRNWSRDSVDARKT